MSKVFISGSIAIVRNAQVIVGLNSTEQEEKDNILRAEIVVQRDGLPSGRALFRCDVERQRCTEFTKEQRKNYDELYGKKLEESFKKGNPNFVSLKCSFLIKIISGLSNLFFLMKVNTSF